MGILTGYLLFAYLCSAFVERWGLSIVINASLALVGLTVILFFSFINPCRETRGLARQQLIFCLPFPCLPYMKVPYPLIMQMAMQPFWRNERCPISS